MCALLHIFQHPREGGERVIQVGSYLLLTMWPGLGVCLRQRVGGFWACILWCCGPEATNGPGQLGCLWCPWDARCSSRLLQRHNTVIQCSQGAAQLLHSHGSQQQQQLRAVRKHALTAHHPPLAAREQG